MFMLGSSATLSAEINALGVPSFENKNGKTYNRNDMTYVSSVSSSEAQLESQNYGFALSM